MIELQALAREWPARRRAVCLRPRTSLPRPVLQTAALGQGGHESLSHLGVCYYQPDGALVLQGGPAVATMPACGSGRGPEEIGLLRGLLLY